jgi:hypothetical protein
MPLTDLIRYFNAADSSGDSTMYLKGERVEAWHRGLLLGSLFQPIVDLREERIVGHMAILSAQQEDETPVGSEVAYASCESAGSLIYFDRLCRTLHALNLLAQRHTVGGYLQLAIDPRYLLAVPSQHGLVYEAILKRCGLAPADIAVRCAAGRLPTYPQQGAESPTICYPQSGVIAMKIANNVTELVGNTPLVNSTASPPAASPPLPPSWSSSTPAIASRIASPWRCSMRAVAAGKIGPDTVVLEPTSGNTGIGLAMVCAARGIKCGFVMPETMSRERKLLLKAYGADLILTPGPRA